MKRKILITAALLSMLCVMLGAYAGHGLTKIVDQYCVSIFRMGVQYQMFCCVGFWIIGIFKSDTQKEKWLSFGFWTMLLGMIFFCGMLYSKSLWYVLGIQLPYIVELITPLGGLLIIASWLSIAIHFIVKK